MITSVQDYFQFQISSKCKSIFDIIAYFEISVNPFCINGQDVLETCPILIVPKALSCADNSSVSFAYAWPLWTSASASTFILPIMCTKDRTCSRFVANSEESLGKNSYKRNSYYNNHLDQFKMYDTFAFAARSDVINSSGALLKISLIRYWTSVPWSVRKNTNKPSWQIVGWRHINVNHLCKLRRLDSRKWASETILFGGSLGIILKIIYPYVVHK